ncbi:MAG: hypothetical protein K9G67_10080 [Bacteroidales bacterium]|nr:hypothetical protein [Bacteroidales bacterium]MCF8344530.1 hypothetical protein [Bacteroidales bacterium]MCF8349707.1 hypothetical protein [Bacteroidales bacterium]MCF8376692.1 hypothetical protein [Bacteroidales bacterium]MCF8401775.1 hypothetical protein [Bacteroidales bacterium]
MKTKNSVLISIVLIFALYLVGCGGSSLPDNKYLGSLPGLADKYESEIEELEKKSKESDDLKKAFEYSQKAEKLDEEAEAKADEAFAEMDAPIEIPFEQVAYQDKYDIQQLRITKAYFNGMSVEFDALVKKSETHLFGYLRFVDEEGNEIPGWCVTMSNRRPEEGQVAVFKGTYRGLHKLSGLAKVKAMSREYYNENENN